MGFLLDKLQKSQQQNNNNLVILGETKEYEPLSRAAYFNAMKELQDNEESFFAKKKDI